MVRVALIGFGGIAKTSHLGSYLTLEKEGKVKLVSVCDIDPKRFEEKLQLNIGTSDIELDDSVTKYTDWREMLANEEVDLVDICLPTFLHAETTVEVLNMNYNVLCEKPMSLFYEDCCKMVEAAKKSGKKLMIGQCLRFSNKYNYLKKLVADKTYGEVKSAVFHRFSGPPVWGWENWFMNYDRSHGCINDMHIHDIDIIRAIFGEPESVSCCSQDVYAPKDIAHSTLLYPGFSVLAMGDWSKEGMPFSAEFCVGFENATVQLANDTITIYPRGGEAFVADIEPDDFYFSEIKFFVENIESGEENTVNTPESAATSVKLIETLIESSNNNGKFLPFKA